jgi:hypothetical protein
MDYMPISWTNSMEHPWNQKVIRLLAKEFNQNVQACQYQTMTSFPENVGDDFTTTAIQNKLQSRQAILRNALRKKSQASHLSQAEITDIFSKQRMEMLVKARRNERKRNVM